MSNEATAVSAFVAKSNGAIPETMAPLLTDFVGFLKERGQFISTGDIKTEFIERNEVVDKNKVPLVVETCLVCGNQQFEVKAEKKS